MKSPIYITQPGILERKANTLFFVNEEMKRALPINTISEIHCFAPVTLTSGAIKLLSDNDVPVHFYNKYGYYRGSYLPAESQISGSIVVAQASHYIDNEKRLYIAREILEGTRASMISLLKSQRAEYKDLADIDLKGESIEELMGIESQLWKTFYAHFSHLLKFFNFDERNRRPPRDEINAMISYGNSVLYTVTLSEIRKTYLHPGISYLHEPRERRYSLALDLAEIFKPIVVFRVILRLVNKRIIREEHFVRDVGVLLNSEGVKIFLGGINDELSRKVLHPTLRRKVSVRYLIRLEAYSLLKHLIGDKEYKSLRAWW
ncbi:type I-B CRISPR-associated endonuclease Cas1b [Pyrococcus horikoshii]|uniref:CRISPR-associated endonuclease Cas1 n=2 Tax=Pyrococcus horikoshii TaxID=53953 RepID=O57912_PYRHO|nr:type I-B CRISPR-associated endonuclease Cas1b [Pyrococcus horikoshii]BAA29242.1 317aa long hypothetical protein [Pyrococcus horikoshii OT3]HII61484.1 type I-B CRISPR-associated endonuclease Cas1 [Pyrococcus horikoshii]